MTERNSYFAPCPRGVEALLADELRALRMPGVRPQRAGVLFTGSVSQGYRVALWSRLASRVLMSLGQVPADSADALYEAVLAMPWEDHLAADGTLAVDVTGTNEALRNTQFTAVRVKDAIADRFRERTGTRPSVDTANPDLRINVAVRSSSASISLDLSGEPLHRRGYREAGVQVAAPMKETLAAAVLAVAGWAHVAERGGAFVDPMCGSGTLAIEAAMIAGDVAPGIMRPRWGFDRWLGHDEAAWHRLIDDADERAEKGRSAIPPIFGFDSDERSIEIARACVRRAGLEGHVAIEQRAVSALAPVDAPAGLVATNPPYGERLADRAGLPTLYADLSNNLRAGYAGWQLAVISSDPHLARGLRLDPQRTHDLFNGRIESPVSVFAVPELAEQVAPDATAGASAFANRLRKMAKHYEKWARRADVSCYRVYDADLPDYAVTVDVYDGAGPDAGRRFAYVAEYAAPAEISVAKAALRLDDVAASVPVVLGLAAGDVFVKTRERQRGESQYGRVGQQGVTAIVEEGGLQFEVNLSDYLDTGIFLDHRLTRGMLRDMAPNARFLNLFAYTGTASVYAADGDARSTTTVDLSQTYLDWAGRNMARNGFTGPQHTRLRAETFDFLREARDNQARYDLVFCDPPTFSNSKRMGGTFDVQRDHVALVIAIGKVLEEGGTIVFSCNRRKFALDADTLAAEGFTVKDITAQTIPKDFERRPSVHSCWTIRRA